MPHIVTMGRDEILQQTPLKSHLIKKGVFKTLKNERY
ncbi:cag pathogenicity island protein [Helicobacter pylori]|nr:cag pathogenicity island protein [Helicobacter pylori]